MMQCEFAFGHDEYAYLWALHNKVALPPEGLAMLRLHSCYPWHTGKAYRELMAPGDEALEALLNVADALLQLLGLGGGVDEALELQL